MKRSEDELDELITPEKIISYRVTRYPSVELRSESGKGLTAGIQIEASLSEGERSSEETLVIKYRTSGGATMQTEAHIDKQAANLGKCPKFIVNELFKKYGVHEGKELTSQESALLMDSFSSSTGVDEGTRKQIEEILKCNTLNGLNLESDGKPLSVENIENLARKEPKDKSDELTKVIWPRVIDFLDLLAKAKNAGKIDEVVQELYKGAKKESDMCAPYVKVS